MPYHTTEQTGRSPCFITPVGELSHSSAPVWATPTCTCTCIAHTTDEDQSCANHVTRQLIPIPNSSLIYTYQYITHTCVSRHASQSQRNSLLFTVHVAERYFSVWLNYVTSQCEHRASILWVQYKHCCKCTCSSLLEVHVLYEIHIGIHVFTCTCTCYSPPAAAWGISSVSPSGSPSSRSERRDTLSWPTCTPLLLVGKP